MWSHTNTKYSEIITSLNHLTKPCLGCPRICPFSYQGAVMAHIELSLQGYSSLYLYLCLAVLYPKYRSWHLFLLNFILLLMAQYHNLPRALCKASHPSKVLTTPPSLISSGNSLRVHLIPAFWTLINILNRIGHQVEPWGTLLMIGYLSPVG